MDGKNRYKQRGRRKRRRRGTKGNFFPIAVMVVFVLGCGAVFHSLLGHPATFVPAQEHRDTEAPTEAIPGITVDLSQLHSPYAILIDCESGSCLAEHNSQERIYPASLTKIMTAVLAVENTADMEEVVTVPEDIFGQLYAEDASMAGFQPGESARLWDLLYGILLPSGAECCLTFACRIAGSEAAFVEMMNRKAEELGLAHTHFCNATGLHDPNHYSTVADISVLLRYALQGTAFKAVFTGNRYTTPPSPQHPDGLTFVSTMFQYMDSAEVTGGRILGGKTGYTEEAGQCLASLAEVGGKEYILVTARAEGTHETEQFHILDAQKVYSQIGASLAADDADNGTGYWWEDDGTGYRREDGADSRTSYWRENDAEDGAGDRQEDGAEDGTGYWWEEE